MTQPEEIQYTYDYFTSDEGVAKMKSSYATIAKTGNSFSEKIDSYMKFINVIPVPETPSTNNVTNILNLMTGIDLGQKFVHNYPNVDYGRTQRFYNFWNNILNPSDLGLAFAQFDSTNPVTNLTAFTARNFFLTYISVLVFERMLSSPDAVNMSTPLDIFTEKSSPFFCKASENLRQFFSGAAGVGNFPIYISYSPTSTSDYESYLQNGMNKGYFKHFCNGIFVKSCPKVEDPNNNQKCIQDYRTKIAKSPVALSWCGCFTPLPDWAKKIYTEKNTETSGSVETIKEYPNACDNLCFGPPGLTIIKLYQVPYILDSQINPGTVIGCPSTICVIDDNAVNAVNTTGNVNFYQICPKQPGQITRCYLDVTKPGVLDNVRSGDNGMITQALFKQDCPDAVCYKINDQTGEQIITKCNDINTPSTGGLFSNNKDGKAAVEKYEKIYSVFWDGILIIIFLLILFEFAYVEIHRYMQRSKLL